jgi:superfamily II DNA or RNA helicase
MKDSRHLTITVGPVLSRVDGPAPSRELFEAFAVWERGGRREVFPCYRADQAFYTGLLPEVTALLDAQGIGFSVVETRRRPPAARRWPLRVSPRPYQESVAERVRTNLLVLAKLPSAAGKTIAALAALARTGVARALYLTDRLDLACQFADVARGVLGLEPGFAGAGRFDVDAPLVVACVDSALARVGRLGAFDLTIADEAHAAAAPTYFELVERVGSPYRLGLTATPFRSRREEDLLLRALFGAPVELAGLDALERDGFIARPRLRTARVEAPPLDLTLVWRELEEALVDCGARNELIVREALGLAGAGHNTLVLVRLIRHGEALQARFRAEGREAPFLTGSTPVERRQEALRAFREGRGGIVIGTEVLAVGVDVPSLGGLVLACGQHAKVATLQKVGRAMRAAPGAPAAVKVVVDFDDGALHPTLGRHSQARRKWMVESLGLREEEADEARGLLGSGGGGRRR